MNLTDPDWHGPGNVARLSMVRTAATPGPHDRRTYLALGVYSIQAHYSLKRRARAAPVRPAGYADVSQTEDNDDPSDGSTGDGIDPSSYSSWSSHKSLGDSRPW